MCVERMNAAMAIYVFSSPITASGKSGCTRSCSSLCPPPQGAALCVYKRGVMVAECVSAAGYFVFGGEDMANQTTSHMKGSSRSI